jgi:hypothetical protein
MKKLKKSSLAFKEVYNIEEACLTMLAEKVFSPNCT